MNDSLPYTCRFCGGKTCSCMPRGKDGKILTDANGKKLTWAEIKSPK